jgi:hypothetical protein
MRIYDYFTFGASNNYGEQVLSSEPVGKVKMAINITSQSIQDNINYQNSEYMGLSYSLLDDNCVVQYGEKKLKVLYVNDKGRLKQIFMAEI